MSEKEELLQELLLEALLLEDHGEMIIGDRLLPPKFEKSQEFSTKSLKSE